MSVLGVILGIIGIVAALLAAVLGIIGGIPAIILGLLAVLFGCLARRNKRGIPSIVVGVLVIVLAVALTFSGISSAKYYLNQVKANPEKAPVLARYAEHVRPEYGFLGYLTVTPDENERKLIVDEVKVLLENANQKAAAPAAAPVKEFKALNEKSDD